MSYLLPAAELIAFTAAVTAVGEGLRRLAHHQQPLSLHLRGRDPFPHYPVERSTGSRPLSIAAPTAQDSVMHRRVS
jgi:hypothetical protein